MNPTLLLSLLLAGLPPFQLHPLGDLHGAEVTIADGDEWLALRIGPEGARLEPTPVRVEAIEDPLLDEPGERSGRRVRAAELPDAVLLLAGNGLRAGPVAIAAHATMVDWRSEVLAIELAGQPPASLRLQCDEPGTPMPQCGLWLEQAGQRQQLAQYPAHPGDDGQLAPGDDAPIELRFAGDLDGDGRLDLILDTSEHYNVAQPTLFLSGAAGAGELLRAVASHRRTGC
jgi:hypothetical protein